MHVRCSSVGERWWRIRGAEGLGSIGMNVSNRASDGALQEKEGLLLAV
jgi:hypothetical protein